MKALNLMLCLFALGSFTSNEALAQTPEPKKELHCISSSINNINLYFYIEVITHPNLRSNEINAYWVKRTGRYSHSRELIFKDYGRLIKSEEVLNFENNDESLKLLIDRPGHRPNRMNGNFRFVGPHEVAEYEMDCTIF
jgi:hypothetical protein